MIPAHGPLASLLLIAITLVVATTGCADSDPVPGRLTPREIGSDAAAVVETSWPLPPLSAATLEGDTLHMASYRGSMLLINFWATWCGPCIREIPDLRHLDSLAGTAVVGVALFDPDTALVQSFVAEHRVGYPVVMDPDGAWADAMGGVYVMPSSFVVDRSGQVIRRITGLVPADSLQESVLAPVDTGS